MENLQKNLLEILAASGLSEQEIKDALTQKIDQKKRKEEVETYQREYLQKLRALDNQDVQITFEQFKDLVAREYVNNENRALEVDQQNKTVLTFLFSYFFGYEAELHSLGCATPQIPGYNQEYRLDKGIMLQGLPGTGKTSVLKSFRKNPQGPFAVVSCMEIAHQYATGGYQAIEKYKSLLPSTNKYFGFDKMGWCFDDLGAERAIKHYGNEANVMEEILFIHSNKSDSRGKIHISTNLSIPEIENIYGQRIASRLKQMFNIVFYGNQAKDRRR